MHIWSQIFDCKSIVSNCCCKSSVAFLSVLALSFRVGTIGVHLGGGPLSFDISVNQLISTIREPLHTQVSGSVYCPAVHCWRVWGAFRCRLDFIRVFPFPKNLLRKKCQQKVSTKGSMAAVVNLIGVLMLWQASVAQAVMLYQYAPNGAVQFLDVEEFTLELSGAGWMLFDRGSLASNRVFQQLVAMPEGCDAAQPAVDMADELQNCTMQAASGCDAAGADSEDLGSSGHDGGEDLYGFESATPHAEGLQPPHVMPAASSAGPSCPGTEAGMPPAETDASPPRAGMSTPPGASLPGPGTSTPTGVPGLVPCEGQEAAGSSDPRLQAPASSQAPPNLAYPMMSRFWHEQFTTEWAETRTSERMALAETWSRRLERAMRQHWAELDRQKEKKLKKQSGGVHACPIFFCPCRSMPVGNLFDLPDRAMPGQILFVFLGQSITVRSILILFCFLLLSFQLLCFGSCAWSFPRFSWFSFVTPLVQIAGLSRQ